MKIPVEPNLTDEQIRNLVIKDFSSLNGYYTTKICKNCGAYWTSPKGDIKNARIVSKCKECFEEE